MSNRKSLFVLGAGVDMALGLPSANGLIPALAEFTSANGQGFKIHQTLKSKLPNLRFNFEKFVDDAIKTFLERQLTQPTILVGYIDELKSRNPNLSSEKVDLFREIMIRIEKIYKENRIPDDLVARIAKIAYQSDDREVDDTLIRLRGIQLDEAPQAAVQRILKESIQTHSNDNDLEKAFNNYLVRQLFGFEKLLVDYFAGFYTKNEADIKKYLYMSWILWSYFRIRMAEILNQNTKEFYDVLESLPDTTSILSFNYTNFFSPSTRERVRYFHGNCESYIRFDNREFIGRNDDRIKAANDADSISALINNLEIEISSGRYYIPAIIPPLAFKPVISVEYLEEWYLSSQAIQETDQLIIIGYSFNYTDEHFNDLLRKKANAKKLVIINPEIDQLTTEVCRLMRKREDDLNAIEKAGFSGRGGNDLIFLRARAEELSVEKLNQIML
jgi:hypothetical protein